MVRDDHQSDAPHHAFTAVNQSSAHKHASAPAVASTSSKMIDQAASDRSFARRVVIAVGITVLALIFVYLLQYVGYVLLLGFAGILLAVGFDGLTLLVQKHTPLTRGWSLTAVLAALITLVGALGALLGPNIVDQMTQLGQRLPESVETLRGRLEHYEWGRVLLHNAPPPQELLPSTTNMMSRITGAFSTALGTLTNVFVIVVVGVYMAISPGSYRKSAVRLLPPKSRDRAHDVFAALGHALRRWFAGRLVSMALVGILTYLGLSWSGVPLSLALGLIAAIFEFVPYLGPILTLVPIVLVAALESPILVLYALPVYAFIQLAESYLIEPLIEERAVSIPPAYLIIVQVLGGVLAGVVGVLLAAPLAVVVTVIIQMLYIEDTLGDTVQVMGETNAENSAAS
jgi:predicted PurR-regulated permease PerM